MFELSRSLTLRFASIGVAEAATADDFFLLPEEVTEFALAGRFTPAGELYPGRTRAIEPSEDLRALQAKMLGIVNSHYLPRIDVVRNGRRLERFTRVHCDFAIVDRRPDELLPLQSIPHTDQVAVFALVYLSRRARGGTLFFQQRKDAASAPPKEIRGYASEATPGWTCTGRIEPRFNRLAVYPGFIPHSGEICGSWIQTEARFTRPRLTMRMAFFE